MVRFLLTLLIAAVSMEVVFAQNPALPLEQREVSGVIIDRQKEPVIGATITLTTSGDTIRAVTDNYGVFVFKGVKSSVFYINVHSLSHKPVTYHFLESDMDYHVVLEPIVLEEATKVLDEVEIKALKGITYKTDTVEYVAADYVVRADARVEDLIRKMEGVEVSKDGSVTHQGEKVAKAQLNGRNFSGGNVVKTIRTLPAEMVDKIQIVDDYGELAARTGIKEGNPDKVLNITTKDERSAGRIFRLYAGGGNDERYEGRANLVFLNENQVITADGWIKNTVNGIAGDETGLAAQIESNGGTTNTSEPSVSYTSDLGKNVEINTAYSYNREHVDATNTFSQQLFSIEGVTFSNTQSIVKASEENHTFNLELDYEIDDNNFLKLTNDINYTSSRSKNATTAVQTGVVAQDYNSEIIEDYVKPSIEGSLLYQHIFEKTRRNLSMNLRTSFDDYSSELDQVNTWYSDEGQVEVYNHYLDARDNASRTYQGVLTFVEPITPKAQLEFKGDTEYHDYDNEKIVEEVGSDGGLTLVDPLSNAFTYSFMKTSLGLSYRYGLDDSKLSYSIGVTALPTTLETFNISSAQSSRETDFTLLPILRIQYAWSQLRRISLDYSGNTYEPSAQQIQPVRDILDPQNHIVGNQNLKPYFEHEVNTKYNHYIPNARVNLSTNIKATLTEDKIVNNRLLINSAEYGSTYETRFLNLSGIYGINANYNVQRQFVKQGFIIALNGTTSHNHYKVANNGIPYVVNSWRITNRLGPKAMPFEWLEVNFNILHDHTTASYTLSGLNDLSVDVFGFDLDGQINFLKACSFKYGIRKQYMRGIPGNDNNNPLVADIEFEMKFFKKRNGALRIQVSDLFDQNHFVNRDITEIGVTDTPTNPQSRYFMLGLRIELQKWNDSSKSKGTLLRRRGDGSFID